MTSNANWQGNLLINNKREILAGVIHRNDNDSQPLRQNGNGRTVQHGGKP